MVMERAQEPLDKYVSNKKLDLTSKVRLVLGLATCVQGLEHASISHCDLKLNNVLVTKEETLKVHSSILRFCPLVVLWLTPPTAFPAAMCSKQLCDFGQAVSILNIKHGGLKHDPLFPVGSGKARMWNKKHPHSHELAQSSRCNVIVDQFAFFNAASRIFYGSQSSTYSNLVLRRTYDSSCDPRVNVLDEGAPYFNVAAARVVNAGEPCNMDKLVSALQCWERKL
jgi:hypothetical protein